MRTLEIDLGPRSYPIRIGSGLIGSRDAFPEAAGRTLRIVTDRTVARHYLEVLRRTLGVDSGCCLALEPGEERKTPGDAVGLIDWLLDTGTARDGMLVVLGGGVIGDLAGFAAAIYQRGIDFIQVPTTLLAQVDSSVGGKTGVNHPKGKNMVGAFHQPRAVIVDLDTLRTLPQRELRAGLAEVIKYGMLGDERFFAWLEEHLDEVLALEPRSMTRVVETCCAMKARIVAGDERESGARALLNLGHTFAHAIETHTGYEWLHGEAVGAGLCLAADLSSRLGWIPRADADRCRALVDRAGLPIAPPPDLAPDRFFELMGHDKKVQSGRLRLVLMRALGQAVVTADFDGALLVDTLKASCRPVSAK